MNEHEAISRMVAPGQRRPGKYMEGVIQIWVTRACDKSCYGCTQGSQLRGPYEFIKPELFEQAVLSLKGYFGVVGMFGGNPAVHPKFEQLCDILRKHIPFEQRGLWCNNPVNKSKAEAMRRTFNPAVSNLNVHMDHGAYSMFKSYWPESQPFGLVRDSRHSPCYVGMRDIGIPEEERWELISRCDINQHWSAMIGVFRGELRAWFCEIAGAQAMLHQHEPEYPDTGIPIPPRPGSHMGQYEYTIPGVRSFVPITAEHWWELPMVAFRHQVRKHCHDCGVPLRGYGELACSTSPSSQEQVSAAHQAVFNPKQPHRRVELVTVPSQLHQGRIDKVTHYVQNASK